MTTQPRDKTGAAVDVALDRERAIPAFTVALEGSTLAGRADFVDSPVAENERIFFHTEVDEQFGGRGLAGILLREALADSIESKLTVVPVCPLFAAHLQKHGDAFTAEGGAFRDATDDDMAVVRAAVRAARSQRNRDGAPKSAEEE